MKERVPLGRLRIACLASIGGLRIRAWLPWVAAVAFAAVVSNTAFAQDAPLSGVRISFTSDRSTLTVGDLVELTLEVAHPAGHVVVVPRLGPEWGSFEVLSQTPAQTVSNGDGARTTRQQLRVTLFTPGTFETPGLPISVRSPDGSVERVFPDPVRLTVSSVLSSPDEQLKDIRSSADLSTPLWEQPAARALAALAILSTLGAVGYLLYRRSRRQEELPEPVIETRRPWEIATQELERIERLDLARGGDFKEHYTLVDRVMRAYLQATYLSDASRMNATDMSTEEIRAAIWQSSLDNRIARLVVEFLQEADLVKFANYAPPVSRAYEAVGQARNFVVTTGPVFEEAPPQDSTYVQGAATT